MSYQQILQRATMEREDIVTKLVKAQAACQEIESGLQAAIKGNDIISNAAASAREQVKDILEGLVSLALNEVFPEEEFEFFVNFDITYNKTSVKFELQQGGMALDPIDSCGGGVADIVSFMLRIACIYLSGSRRLLIADEPFKFLSADKRPFVYSCLKSLAEQYNMNVLMVSHDAQAANYADRIYKVCKVGKNSTAQLVEA